MIRPEPDLPQFFTLHAHDSLDSTNDEALRLAGEGAPEGTLVRAKTQTQGKGRMGRAWISDPGNLFFSVIFRPDVALQAAAQLSFVAAVAVSDALDELDVQGVQTKWPNDVLVGGRKVAGILLESRAGSAGMTEAVVAGVGLNVTSHPEDVQFPATNLSDAGYRQMDAAGLLSILCAHLESRYRSWRREGFQPIRAAWLGRAAHKNDQITVRTNKEEIAGVFSGLDEEGALILQTEDGERIIRAGDVYF